jgi:predicted Zn finger-like uncharacterized protein
VKFLCDRCKTRYSIGDDRVRGKILKIRCKNCANVITVREGMTADEPDRRLRPTTAAPMAAAAAPAGSALGSAFVAQMTAPQKPPPALEEEWYVSIDGEQAGPFSLADAQRWVGGKAFDAELHCWSEGFDDWLPVDKVSHFRGLRKKPAPPPALPRVAPRTPNKPVPRIEREEETPKPLFAATMASLEKATQPPLDVPAAQVALKAPAPGFAAKANGTGPAAAMPALPRANPAQRSTPVPSRAGTQQGTGSHGAMSAGAKALASAFDTSNDPGDSATAIESMPFSEDIATRSESKRNEIKFDQLAKQPQNGAKPAPAPHDFDRDDDDSNGAPLPDEDELQIGEVSRVVKLADIAKMSGPQRKISRAPVVGRSTGSAASLGRSTQSAAALRVNGSSPGLDPNMLAAGGEAAAMHAGLDPLAGESVVAPVVAKEHRRGLIMLIGVAAVLLAGVAIALVMIIRSTSDDDTGGGLGHIKEIDSSRPEEIVRHTMQQTSGEGSGAIATNHNPKPHYVQHPNGAGSDDTPGTGNKLKSDEIEAMAQKQSSGTQRCYMRAQRGASGIEIADLKKLSVTLTIDKTGTVTDVAFMEKTAEALLTCLRTQIKLWKFRESPGGLYRIVLAFAS